MFKLIQASNQAKNVKETAAELPEEIILPYIIDEKPIENTNSIESFSENIPALPVSNKDDQLNDIENMAPPSINDLPPIPNLGDNSLTEQADKIDHKTQSSKGWGEFFTELLNIFKVFSSKEEATQEIKKALMEENINVDPTKVYDALELSQHLPSAELEKSVMQALGEIDNTSSEVNTSLPGCIII